MSDVRLETRMELAYLLPHAESFWRWSGDGQTLVWRDGRTIAFRNEVWAVLRRLAPSAIPPIGGLVLLLAATRESWDKPDEIVTRVLAGYSSSGHPLMSAVISNKVRQEVAGVVDDLASVAALPPELRQTLRGRCALAEFVLRLAKPAMDEPAGERLLALLDDGVDAESLRETNGHDSDYSRLTSELDALRPGLARVAAEPVSTWERTGLDRSIEPAGEIDLPAAKRVRALLGDLQSDPQLAGIAMLARDLLAAVHVPRALAAPEEIPIGGVSDISNRGPLDRLLVSELAHDDLTLAVRVALNEALYLRRESPAKHPPFSRAILLDVGIRMWGVPRLFAAAVGLALAASADERGDVQTFRGAGRSAKSVDLTTRDGVNGLLEALEPDPHPAPALNDLLVAITDAKTDVQTFIVTHEAAFEDPQFTTALRTVDAPRDWYVATVSGDGSFVLWRTGTTGREEVCRAKLSLDEIAPAETKPARPAAPLLAHNPHLPLVLFVEPFPLLLPAAIVPRHAVLTERSGLVAVTHDRRLMRWARRDTAGGVQLHPGLPAGQILGLFADEQRDAVHVVIARGKQNVIDILTFDLHTGRVDRREYARNHPRRVFFYNGAICLGYANEVRVLGPDNWAERVVKLPPEMGWCRVGRFVRSWTRVYAFTPDGLHAVADAGVAEPFERAGSGPWLLRPDGTITTADGHGIIVPDRPSAPAHFILLATSPDGNELLAKVAARDQSGIYHVKLSDDQRTRWQPAMARSDDPHGHAALLGGAMSWTCPLAIRNRFGGIVVDGDTGLLTLTGAGSHMSIESTRNGELRLSRHVRPTGTTRRWEHRPFVRFSAPPGARYTLKMATWSDGSRAFLDSRGLLHLVSADRKLPQLTLALSDYPLAGWTSDGRTFGWAYFLPEQPTDTAVLGAALIRQFTGRIG